MARGQLEDFRIYRGGGTPRRNPFKAWHHSKIRRSIGGRWVGSVAAVRCNRTPQQRPGLAVLAAASAL